MKNKNQTSLICLPLLKSGYRDSKTMIAYTMKTLKLLYPMTKYLITPIGLTPTLQYYFFWLSFPQKQTTNVQA